MIAAKDVGYVGKLTSNLKALTTVAKYLRQILLVLIDIREGKRALEISAPRRPE